MEKINILSIVIPVFNEERTIEKILTKVFDVDFGKIKLEVVVVNDGSTDNTLNILNNLKFKFPIKLISYKQNKGKGSALRVGFKYVTGDVVVIQDGDIEYNPNDFKKMLLKMGEDEVSVVYGSRILGRKQIKYSGFSFYIGGLLLTKMVNVLYRANITDESTCYKMFETRLLKSLKLKSKRFEFCPEVTAKVLKMGIVIHEVPIDYNPRGVIEGKKINMRDFLEAVVVLICEKFS